MLAAAQRAGSTVGGRYRLLQPLGAGGFGTVWLALDGRLERKVAIKLLHRLDPSARRQLRREARALAGLDHPNVVRVFDVEPSGRDPLLAMEYVRGQSLADAVDELPRDAWRRVLALYRQAGEGLAAAHAVGIIHRDFKPANAMVDEEGNVKVLDFGIAGEAPEREGDGPRPLMSTTIRKPGVLGTLAYMAPEQHRGENPDVAADVFCFGASLYEALFRELPYGRGELTEIAAAKHRGPPPRPSKAVPTSVYRVVARALHPDPERRWRSMSDLLRALRVSPGRRWLIGAGVGAALVASGSMLAFADEDPCEDAAQSLSRRWEEDRPALAETMRSRGLTKARRKTVERVFTGYAEEWSAAYRETCARDSPTADRIRHCLLALREAFPTDADGVHVARLSETLTPVTWCFEEGASVWASLPPDEAVRGEIAELQGYLERETTRFQVGLGPSSEELRNVVQRARDTGHASTISRALELDAAAKGRRNETGVVERLTEAYDLAVQARDERRALSIALTMVEHLRDGNNSASVDTWRGYARARVGEAREGSALWIRWHTTEGLLLSQRGDHEAGAAMLATALAVLDEGPTHIRQRGILMERWASVMYELERFDEAVQGYRAALRLQRETQGPGQRLLIERANLAVVLGEAGLHTEAVELWDELLAEVAGHGDDDARWVWLSAGNELVRHAPSRDRARGLLQAVVQAEGLDSEHGIIASASLALADERDGKLEEALAGYRRVLSRGRHRDAVQHVVADVRGKVEELERSLAGEVGEKGAPRLSPP